MQAKMTFRLLLLAAIATIPVPVSAVSVRQRLPEHEEAFLQAEGEAQRQGPEWTNQKVGILTWSSK